MLGIDGWEAGSNSLLVTLSAVVTPLTQVRSGTGNYNFDVAEVLPASFPDIDFFLDNPQARNRKTIRKVLTLCGFRYTEGASASHHFLSESHSVGSILAGPSLRPHIPLSGIRMLKTSDKSTYTQRKV